MKGESDPIDLPFLFSQGRILRASSLTPDLKMRYGSDIHIISEILPFFGYSHISSSQIISLLTSTSRNFS